MPAIPKSKTGAAAVFTAVLLLAAALLVPTADTSAAGRLPATPMSSVIVQTTGNLAAAIAAVEDAGGHVTRRLPIVVGFAAAVPEAAVASLRHTPGVRAVTPNHRVDLLKGPKPPGSSTNLKSVYPQEIGADSLWRQKVTGRGIRVALIDTGVAPVADVSSRLVPVADPVTGLPGSACVNFSGESGCNDTYGHGTFMAGLIAGTGAASGGKLRGVAPDAEIISIKIAGRDGSADVTKVLAALQWVVSFRSTYGIRIVNLSLGTDSSAPYQLDPLNFAVERAWQSGIAVIVSASNRGPDAGTISKPADDPLVITVGAVDDRETPTIGDDRLPNFSGRGPTSGGLSKPDVVAPGARVISLRSPGSYIEEQAPPAAGADPTYRRGSGTSMSAAVTSGAAALALQANPTWTPDRLKYALMETARPVATADPLAVGAGIIDAYTATRNAPAGLANQDVTTLSSGLGLLDASRGSSTVSLAACLTLDPPCLELLGEQTAQALSWDAVAYTTSLWSGSSWYTSQWVLPAGSSWYGSSWYGSSWYGAPTTWTGSSWYGTTDATGYGTAVAGSSWYGAWQ